MARKKRQPDGDGPRKRPSKPAGSSRPIRPGPRVDGGLQAWLRPPHGEPGDNTPLARAEALVDRARDEPNAQRRIRLAREALDVCPDCADAYLLLAEHTRRGKQSLDLYEKAVAAAERALGPTGFQQAVGHFWGVSETRPYMRARLELALALWEAGRRDEAVGHLQELLRLNPNDNQGARYTLASNLLFLDRDDDLVRLLQAYPDDDLAAWAYTRALLAFRQEGDSLPARRLLKAAKKANKHVPDYLMGRKFPPSDPPGPYSPGDESEALNYVGSFLAGWKATPGAIAWLRAHDEASRKRKARATQPRGPLDLVKKWARDRLPQTDERWQAEFRPMPLWIRAAGDPVRPWLVLVTSPGDELILAHQVLKERPSAALLWDTLIQAMQHPMAGEPHRPTELQVRTDERWEALRPHLEEIGVKVETAGNLDDIETLFAAMSEHMGAEAQPGLLDAPGVTPEQVGRFYEAAASFFQQAPWKKVGYESAIRVECDRFQSGPWYAVLMGQSGLTSGLALYDDMDTLLRLWAGNLSDEEGARETVGTSVTFGEEWQIPVADLEAAGRYGWKLARPDAYPEVIHKERGLSCRPPLAWELQLMEACLRTVPEFVNRRQQDDPAREELTVPGPSGELKLVLSWVVEEGNG